jgi:hypothetical protein
VTVSDAWMTPQLREAAARLKQAIAEASQACRETSAAAREHARSEVTETAEYRRLERATAEHFRSGRAGPAAQTLQQRVDRGELTWRQIRDGGCDPDATRLYLQHQRSMLDTVAELHRQLASSPDDEAGAAAHGTEPDGDPDDDPESGPILYSAR